MNGKIKTESIDKLMSLSKDELDNIFSELSLSEIEDLMKKINEEVE